MRAPLTAALRREQKNMAWGEAQRNALAVAVMRKPSLTISALWQQLKALPLKLR